MIHESGVALVAHALLDAVVRLAPPAVVDAVVVVARARYRRLEEVGVLQDGCRRHETAARVAVDTHAVDVDEAVAGRELLDGGFLVGQTVIAQIAVTVVVVPLRAVGVAAAVTDGDYDESRLRQTVGAHGHAREGIGCGLDLRSRVDVVDDGVAFGRVEIERLVHYAVQIGHAVGGLDGECLGEFVSVGEQLREVAGFERHELVAQAVVQSRLGDGVHARVVVDEVAAGVVHL